MALQALTINNFAVIKSTQVDFNDGFIVISGETGAGKSIVIDALGLLLGARAESSLVRHGETRSDLSAHFNVMRLPQVKEWLLEQDLNNPDDDNELVIRRVVQQQGPTKCYVNDRMITLATLKQLGLLLIDIHGQHEHQSLLRRATQRDIVDQRAQIKPQVDELAKLARSIHATQSQLERAEQNISEHQNRLDLLRFQLNELQEIQLKENEFDELDQEFNRLSHADSLRSDLQACVEALEQQDGSAIELIETHALQLEKATAVNPDLKGGLDLLNTALAHLKEGLDELRPELQRIEADPQRLSEVEARRDVIITLARKHRCAENSLLDHQAALETELDALTQADEAPQQLQQQLDALLDEYHTLAKSVSEQRQHAANQLSLAITEQMQDLGMEGGQCHINVSSDDTKPHSVTLHGYDNISFDVATNAGMPLSALNKTASGGELSRISLAIQVVASQDSPSPTLVFDEVDVGVGGRIGQIVGERLRKLGRHAQVICITHLPQVAALGEQHLLVNKTVQNGETATELTPLDTMARVDELSRMLGGVTITENTRLHAKEMLNLSAS